MNTFGIFGTGGVGWTIATRLIELGYTVCLGSRTGDNAVAAEWAAVHGDRARHGTFAEAAEFGSILFNCTKGEHSPAALTLAGAEHMAGKILIDISNPLDFSRGMPPSLFPGLSNTHSLGEEIQNRFPLTHVVKTLNMVNADIMVRPELTGGTPTMFVAGNVAEAKSEVTELLGRFGWQDIMDLGDLSAARGMESWLPLWIKAWGAIGHARFGLKLIR